MSIDRVFLSWSAGLGLIFGFSVSASAKSSFVNANVSCRVEASTKAASRGTFRATSAVEIVKDDPGGEWAKVICPDGKQGFVRTQYLIPKIFSGAVLNCRENPSTESAAHGKFPAGGEVVPRAAALENGWSQVTCPDGRQGYVKTEFLSVTAECRSTGDFAANMNWNQPLRPMTRIAYIGDSQSASKGGLGKKLEESLNANGISVVAGRAVCGATVEAYLTGGVPGICNYKGVTSMSVSGGEMVFPGGPGTTVLASSLMAEADAVVVQLGDNHLFDESTENIEEKSKQLAKEILSRGKECVWIGPAAASCNCRTWPLKRAVSEAIERSLREVSVNGRSCRFVDSFNLTAKNAPNGDCIHYGSEYDKWHGPIEGAVLRALGVSSTKSGETSESGMQDPAEGQK